MRYYSCDKYMESAEEILLYFRKTHKKWRDEIWIFRGQCNPKHLLIPSAWRANETENLITSVKSEICEKYGLGKSIPLSKFKFDENTLKRIEAFVWQVTCESYLVNDFINRSNAVALPVEKPNPFGKTNSTKDLILMQIEILYGYFIPSNLKKFIALRDSIKKYNKLLKMIIESKNYFNPAYQSPIADEKYLSVLALAQHHNIPTRLLDWTKDPLKSIFFALDGANINTENCSIFALSLSDSLISDPFICSTEDFPHYQFNFLHKQEGVFTYMPYADTFFLKNGYWPAIENWKEALGFEFPSLHKITFPFSLKPKLLKLLEQEGITKEALMPTYNHVAESIRSRLAHT